MSPASHTELTVTNLSKTYKSRKVVNNVSLFVKQGEIVGLLGPNGAGKTTCFYMILGIVTSETGSIKLNGQEISLMPVHVRAKLGIGYLPQEPSVFRKLSVKDNILAVLELRKNLSKQQQLEILDSLLDEFNIQHVKDTMGISLSGGERRRVEIARSLACEPQFILLDEPFAGVDPISIGDIKDIIRHLAKRNIGVIITDHNVRETLDICDRAYIMHEGKEIARGTPEQILVDSIVRQVYLGEEFKI
jgi:lipopolysaccharide export system ATP-binding protein